MDEKQAGRMVLTSEGHLGPLQDPGMWRSRRGDQRRAVAMVDRYVLPEINFHVYMDVAQRFVVIALRVGGMFPK